MSTTKSLQIGRLNVALVSLFVAPGCKQTHVAWLWDGKRTRSRAFPIAPIRKVRS